MLLQAITIGEQYYDYHIRHVDFIGKYVFPGGSLPSISALSQSVGRISKMRLLQQVDITPHYERTMFLWRNKFLDNLEAIRSIGYDDSFLRQWHFYLCYCEAAFAERRVHCSHLIYVKPKCTLDMESVGEFSPGKQVAKPIEQDRSSEWVLLNVNA
jgi:cyclopropane-fatty-acyl-phospholipid synthase